MMPDDFDPYLEWLGIAPYYRPPNHYQLLGLPEFESDSETIAQAADARMAEIRKYQMGPRGRYSQKLLNELAAARVCLLNAESKSAYDAELLRRRYPTTPTAFPVASFAPVAPAPVPPMPVAPPVPQTVLVSAQSADAAGDDLDEETQGEGIGWWLPLGALFVVIIIGTSLGLVLLARRNKPVAKVEPNQEAEVILIEEQPEPASAESSEDDASLIRPDDNRDLSFPVAAAELSEGLSLDAPTGTPAIGGWRDETTIARWRFKVARAAIYQVQITYTMNVELEDAEWQLRLEDATKARTIQASSSVGAVVMDEFFWRVPRAGEQTLELSVTGLPSSAKLSLQSLRFINPKR